METKALKVKPREKMNIQFMHISIKTDVSRLLKPPEVRITRVALYQRMSLCAPHGFDIMGPIGSGRENGIFPRQNAGHMLSRQFLSCLTVEEVYKFVEMVSNLW